MSAPVLDRTVPMIDAARRAGEHRAMKNLWRCARLDIAESLRARWFLLYSLLFGASVVLPLFLDLILPGAMVKGPAAPELADPLQLFRAGAMVLFDPNLMLLGPAAYVILDHLGRAGCLAWALAYPLLVGTLCAVAGFRHFRRSDLP